MTWQKRIAIAPEIPTMDEAGLHGFYFALWSALFARAARRRRLWKTQCSRREDSGGSGNSPETGSAGCIIPSREEQTPNALGTYQKAEIAKWWPVVKAAGIKPE